MTQVINLIIQRWEESQWNNIHSLQNSNTSVEKENEQPNLISSEKSGHLKSDTVIITNEASQKYLLENVLWKCINPKESSIYESSSFIYKTDSSQNQCQDRIRRELTISPELEGIMLRLQESFVKQKQLEFAVAESEKTKEALQSEISDLKAKLNKAESQK